MFQQQLDYCIYVSILTLCVYIDIQMSQSSPTFSYSKRANVQVKEEVNFGCYKEGTLPLALFFVTLCLL